MTDAQEKAAATYNAAADHFDHPALGFWDRFGVATVERLNLTAGAAVLDVCCGAGASAIPAARAVGPAGSVIAVDLAGELLALAEDKARFQGVTNIEFRMGDMMALGYPDAGFDAVICVFGVFFVPDMAGAVAAMWRLIRPGGQLAVTTWGPRIFEPATSALWAAVGAERPDLVLGYNPWDRITDPESLAAVLSVGGVADPLIEQQAATQTLRNPEDWWTIVLGSGYRATVDQLGPKAAARVKASCLDRLARDRVQAVETNVIYARATR